MRPKNIKQIEKKYSKKIETLLEVMKDNTMEELWVELDKLKEQMRKDLEQIGANLVEG